MVLAKKIALSYKRTPVRNLKQVATSAISPHRSHTRTHMFKLLPVVFQGPNAPRSKRTRSSLTRRNACGSKCWGFEQKRLLLGESSCQCYNLPHQVARNAHLVVSCASSSHGVGDEDKWAFVLRVVNVLYRRKCLRAPSETASKRCNVQLSCSNRNLI